MLTTVSHLNNFVFNLTLQNAAGQTDTLGVTGYHKFYDPAEGWQNASDLTIGDTAADRHADESWRQGRAHAFSQPMSVGLHPQCL